MRAYPTCCLPCMWSSSRCGASSMNNIAPQISQTSIGRRLYTSSNGRSILSRVCTNSHQATQKLYILQKHRHNTVPLRTSSLRVYTTLTMTLLKLLVAVFLTKDKTSERMDATISREQCCYGFRIRNQIHGFFPSPSPNPRIFCRRK